MSGPQQTPVSWDKAVHFLGALIVVALFRMWSAPSWLIGLLVFVGPWIFEVLECAAYHRTLSPLRIGAWFRVVDTAWDVYFTTLGGLVGAFWDLAAKPLTIALLFLLYLVVLSASFKAQAKRNGN